MRAPTHTTVQCALLAPHATPCTRPRALALSKVGLNLLFNSKIMVYPPWLGSQRVNVLARNVGFCSNHLISLRHPPFFLLDSRPRPPKCYKSTLRQKIVLLCQNRFCDNMCLIEPVLSVLQNGRPLYRFCHRGWFVNICFVLYQNRFYDIWVWGASNIFWGRVTWQYIIEPVLVFLHIDAK